MWADVWMQRELERIMGNTLPDGVYGGTRLVSGPITRGTVSGGTNSGGTSTPVASSTVYRQVFKDVDGDGDTEEVWVPALEYTSTKDPVTGSTTISIRWADGFREENVITRDNRETNTTWFPDGGWVVETSVPNGPSTYREYNADGSLRHDVHIDSEGNETSTYYGDGYVTASVTEGELNRSVRTNSDGSRIEVQENSETKYLAVQEYSAEGQLQRSQTRWGDNSEEIYMLMPNGKGITYRSGPHFGDSTGESLTLEGANPSEKQMLNDVTNELQDYTGEGRSNAQNGSVEIDNGVQKYRVETTLGTAGNDTITGHGMLVGGKGSDVLYGRERSDVLHGGNGGDNLIGGAGADVLDGGTGFDYAEYHTATAGMVADLSNAGRNTGDAKGDSYTSIEGLSGSHFNDELVGNHLGNELYGLSGNDALEGRAGADWLYGGAGFDYAVYSTATAGVVADLLNAWRNTGEAAGDTYLSIEGLSGSAYNDELVGNHAGNELYGGGDDMLEGRGGGDWMYGGAGTDFASYLTATAGVRASLANAAINTGEAAGDMYFSVEALNGSHYGDVLVGDGGNNSLYGQNGNDELIGGAGADFLSGGQHHDTLSGGAGSDMLNGGEGADVFRFDAALGAGNVDTIVDFSAAEGDKLALETHVFRAFPDVAFVETAYGSSYVNNVMKASAFGIGAVATTSLQRIVYNQATGGLFYDADGTGAAAQVQFAQLKAGLALTTASFSLYTL